MDIIIPVKINDNKFVSSSIDETDASAWDYTHTYASGDRAMVTTPNVHKVYESLVNDNTNHYPPDDDQDDPTYWLEIGSTNRWKAFNDNVGSKSTGPITADLLDDGCTSLTGWTETEDAPAIVEVSPAGQFHFSTDYSTTGYSASISKTIDSPPDQFTIEVELYHDHLGNLSATDDCYLQYSSSSWYFIAFFAADGLYIQGGTGAGPIEVGTNLVVEGASAAWQKWRFEVDKSVESSSQVNVYLDGVLQGSVTTKDTTGSYTDGMIMFLQRSTTAATETHMTSLKVGTGNGEFSSDPIEYVIKPGTVDSLALLNLDATTVDVVMTDSAVEVYNEEIAVGTYQKNIVLLDLPNYPNAELTITIARTAGTPAVGEIILGNKLTIGTTRYSPQIGIIDYSVKEVDDYGNITVVERSYSNRLNCSIRLDNANVDSVFQALANYRATPLVWVASETYSCLIVFGFYKDFQIIIPYPDFSDCSLEIEGII